MLLDPICVPCILDDAISAVDLLIEDKKKKKELTNQFLNLLNDLNYNKIPSFLKMTFSIQQIQQTTLHRFY